MSKVTIRLEDIQLSQLNNQCLQQVSVFVRSLKVHNGVALRMQDPDILVQISDQSHKAKNKKLSRLYVDLKKEILKCLRQTLGNS